MWNISFEMRYVQGVNLQNCPIGGRLNFFWGAAMKKCKKTTFLEELSFLKICSKKPIARLGPCETSRPDDSENVGLIGRVRFLTGVIAAQSQKTVKFCLR